MAVLCSHCGEELMGAVNRCWRCGTELQAHAGRPDVPPIRRSPIAGPLDGPLEAVVLPDDDAARAAVEQESEIPATVRRGSPFRPASPTICVAGPVRIPVSEGRAIPRPQRSYQFLLASQVAAITTPLLATIALLLSLGIPTAALFLAAIAIGFGTWGLYSERRKTAIAGLILASVVLAWAGFGTVVQIYQWVYGVNPFETTPPMPPPSGF